MINKLKNELRYLCGFNGIGKKPNLTGYRKVDTLTAENTKKGMSWGAYHSDNLSQYWDDDNVIWVDDKVLLYNKYNPKAFINSEGEKITIPFSIGVVESVNEYKYGYFEAYGNLPVKNGQWPAFWLTGAITWPPEIDIVEGYSQDDQYGFGRRLQSNVHYKDGDGRKHIKGRNHPLYKGAITHINGHFAALWEADKIEFYYNGFLVRRIKDKKVLNAMNQPMKIILNSAIDIAYAPPSFSATSFREVNVWQRV
jgi:beta-glucanase (GH16 family)